MAVRFDYVNDYLYRSANLPSITSLTIMGWVKVSVDRDNYQGFMAIGTGAPLSGNGAMYYCGTDGNGTQQMAYCPATGSNTAGGLDTTAGSWYYVASVVSGSGSSQFVYYLVDPSNGTVYTVTSNAGSVTAGYMILGDSNYGEDSLDGCCENFLVYDAALTLDEIKLQMWRRVPVRLANINGWYPLLNDTKDYSGNGNDWTENGSLTYEAGPGVGWGSARVDVATSTRLASASYTAPLDAAGTRTAVGLTSANLDTQLTAIDDFLDTEIAAIKAKTDNLPSDPADASDIAAAIAALNNISAADVLTQVNAALNTAISELGVAAPSATPTLRTALMLLYMNLRNASTTTASAKTIKNDAGTTIATAALSDDGTTFTKAEFA